MYQVVQIQCPGCQKVLKAPVDWVAQPLRCKHCKQVFQSQAPVATQQAEPATQPSGDGGFGMFDNLEDPSSAPSRRPRRGSGPVKKLVIATLLLGMVGGLVVVGIKLAPMIEKELGTKVAENKKKKDGDASIPDEPPVKNKKDESTKNPSKDGSVANLNGPKKDGSPAIEAMDPPVKKDNPKKKNDPKKKDPEKPRPPEVYPRRALLINVCDYLYWNPVAFGSPDLAPYPGSSIGRLAYLLTKPPFNMNEQQVTELSDGVPVEFFKSAKGIPNPSKAKRTSAAAPWKQVIEMTLSDFVDSSRPQDRIVVLFAGHVVENDKEAFLVPMEGKKNDEETLIPLKWVYERLAKCRARQKVLILDVCRFPPAQGLERPASEDMGEVLDKVLQTPPAGVQVWSSCIMGQKSIELELGGVFLQAVCGALVSRDPQGIQEPTNTLPVEQLLPKVNQRLAEILGPQKLKQISRLTGIEADGGAPYNPADPLPDRLAIRLPKVDGAEGAAAAEVKSILEEINLQPAVRAHQSPVRMLPPFSSKTLANYKADYISWTEINDLKKDEKKAKLHPLRKAILDAIDAMKTGDLVLQERLIPPGGTFDGKAKAAFLDKQKNPAIIIFELERVQRELKEVEKDRDAETKRFQAHYDFTMARLQSRLVYVYEYNFLLGQIRADNLPPLEPIHNGWRLGSSKDVAVMKKEARVKDMVKNVTKAWKQVAQEHAGTPWAILAAREQLTNLGLEWRPTRD